MIINIHYIYTYILAKDIIIFISYSQSHDVTNSRTRNYGTLYTKLQNGIVTVDSLWLFEQLGRDRKTWIE